MTIELLPALAKAATDSSLIKQIYGDLMKPGVSQVGKALSSVLGLGNTILWPVQLLNERSKISLEINLERYREKMSQTPIEQVIPVAPEIGVPVAEKLSYVADTDLREMYITLLSRASSKTTQSTVHPSFVNVLNNLSPDEALLLSFFQRNAGQSPYIDVRIHAQGSKGFHELVNTYFRLDDKTTLTYIANLPAYISNLEGLGLLRVRSDIKISDDAIYQTLENDIRDTHQNLTLPPASFNFSFVKGKIEVTKFGWLFLAACVVE